MWAAEEEPAAEYGFGGMKIREKGFGGQYPARMGNTVFNTTVLQKFIFQKFDETIHWRIELLKAIE